MGYIYTNAMISDSADSRFDQLNQLINQITQRIEGSHLQQGS
jgi:hypothetical protein